MRDGINLDFNRISARINAQADNLLMILFMHEIYGTASQLIGGLTLRIVVLLDLVRTFRLSPVPSVTGVRLLRQLLG
jgi:hypothetical protein